MTIRHAYSKRVPSKTNVKKYGASLTVQEQAKSTDINNILERFNQTGLIDHVSQYEPQYGDFAKIDYHTMHEQIKTVENAFQELPANVRAQFNHDPQLWLEHIAINENIEDMKDGVIDNEIKNQAGESGEDSSSATSDASNSEPAS
jgi:phage internal scaffolding protein